MCNEPRDRQALEIPWDMGQRLGIMLNVVASANAISPATTTSAAS